MGIREAISDAPYLDFSLERRAWFATLFRVFFHFSRAFLLSGIRFRSYRIYKLNKQPVLMLTTVSSEPN